VLLLRFPAKTCSLEEFARLAHLSDAAADEHVEQRRKDYALAHDHLHDLDAEHSLAERLVQRSDASRTTVEASSKARGSEFYGADLEAAIGSEAITIGGDAPPPAKLPASSPLGSQEVQPTRLFEQTTNKSGQVLAEMSADTARRYRMQGAAVGVVAGLAMGALPLLGVLLGVLTRACHPA